MFLYLRKKVGDFASFIGAICYIFNLKLISHIYAGHITYAVNFASLPLTFFILEKILEKRSFYCSVILGIILSLQFLGGHPQLFHYFSLSLFLFFIFNLISMLIREKDYKKGLQWSFFFIFAFVLCIGLSAILLFPSLEFSKLILRSKTRWSIVSFGSLNFRNFISLVLPGFWGYPSYATYKGSINFWEQCIYVGILPLILAIIGAIFGIRKKIVVFHLFLAVFAIVFAMGKYAPIPLFHLLYKYVPTFKFFQLPDKMICVFVFAISNLSAFGSDFLTKEVTNKKQKYLKTFSAVLFFSSIGIIFFLVKFFSTHRCMPTEDVPILYRCPEYGFILLSSIFILINIFLFLLTAGKLKNKYSKFIIAGIILFDLWMYGLPLIKTESPNKIFTKTETVRILSKDQTKFRVWDLSKEIPQHIAVAYDIETIGGTDPMILKSYVEFTSCLLSPSWTHSLPSSRLPISKIELRENLFFNIIDLLNTKYIISHKRIDVPNLKLIHEGQNKEGENIYIFENLNVLPRAFIVRNAKVIPGVEASYKELKSFNPKEYIIIKEDFPFLHNPGKFKEANIIYYSPNRIDISVDLSTPGFLVLSENWYPGWKAYDNGVEKEVLKANYTLRAIYLEDGPHKVSFIFQPKSYGLGKVISLATLLFIIVCLLYISSRSRKNRNILK